MKASQLQKTLHELADPVIALHSRRFFKTGPGEYGEDDEFLGIRVPQLRKLAKQFKELPADEVVKLLRSRFHEERLTALFVLELQFAGSSAEQQKVIYDVYLDNLRFVNNWDLIDSSAPKIMGGYLYDKPRDILYRMAGSPDLWKRRIAIVSTFHFIRQGDLADTFLIADKLLYDTHDLIHKAVGWMLREAGKRDRVMLESFLQSHSNKMPRTMLRYAIEKFPKDERKSWLTGSAAASPEK